MLRIAVKLIPSLYAVSSFCKYSPEMSVNYSTNSSHSGSFKNCLSPAPFISYTLLLPVFIFVLFVGYQRWRKQRSVVTATVMTSHSDIFTYNLVSLEIFSVVASVLSVLASTQIKSMYIWLPWIYLLSRYLHRRCFAVDRYLAVVHPIKYRGLRLVSAIRIRNISIGCVWLISFGSFFLLQISYLFNLIYSYTMLGFSTFAVCFCSLSVLRVLNQPGPGGVAGNQEQAGLKKKRAFYIIMTIMGTLLLRLLVILITIAMDSLKKLSPHSCLFSSITTWLNQPSSLVSPLLFLYRAGKLCDHRIQQHQWYSIKLFVMSWDRWRLTLIIFIFACFFPNGWNAAWL